MRHRRSKILAIKKAEEREEHKKRQEKLRKRSRSHIDKNQKLGKDTDAWVALFIRDKAGVTSTHRVAGDQSWPPSIQDLIAANPSGTHNFTQKRLINGFWKVVAAEESVSGLVDSDVESVDEGIPAISTEHVPGDTEPDGTVWVDQRPMDEDINEGVAESSVVDPLDSGQLDATPLPQIEGMNTAEESVHPRIDSPEDAAHDSDMLDDAKFGEPDSMAVDTTVELNVTAVDNDVNAQNTTASKIEDSAGQGAFERMARDDALCAVEWDPTTSGYDMMELDAPKSNAQLQTGECDVVEAVDMVYSAGRHHNPGGFGSWQGVNWPKIDPKELLQNWNWVFHSRNLPGKP